MIEKLLALGEADGLHSGPFGFLLDHWVALAVLLVVVGFLLDQTFYLLRYRPWRRWMHNARTFRRFLERTFHIELPWPPDVRPRALQEFEAGELPDDPDAPRIVRAPVRRPAAEAAAVETPIQARPAQRPQVQGEQKRPVQTARPRPASDEQPTQAKPRPASSSGEQPTKARPRPVPASASASGERPAQARLRPAPVSGEQPTQAKPRSTSGERPAQARPAQPRPASVSVEQPTQARPAQATRPRPAASGAQPAQTKPRSPASASGQRPAQARPRPVQNAQQSPQVSHTPQVPHTPQAQRPARPAAKPASPAPQEEPVTLRSPAREHHVERPEGTEHD